MIGPQWLRYRSSAPVATPPALSARGRTAYPCFVSDPGIYRTERGTILRITEDDEGRLSVELFHEAEWVSGPIGMAGLRLAPTTKRLTARQVQLLPQ